MAISIEQIMIEEINTTFLNSSDEYKKNDIVALEEPLEIQLQLGDGEDSEIQSLSVTMRTPGQDEDLSIGFLFTEGVITSIKDLKNPPTLQLDSNKIVVRLSGNSSFNFEQLKRNFYTSSSCGVCGKESIEAIHQVCRITRKNTKTQVDKKVIFSLPHRLREVQKAFISTGGIHAAAFFDSNGTLTSFREDVGRHNALDKLIGAEILEGGSNGFELQNKLLLLSGRASFELIQKAAMAGVRMVCSIGAPSSLAIQTAKSFGMTLIGFLKSSSANIYCGKERIKTA